MVIMAISSFSKIATPPAFQTKVIEQEKWQLEKVLQGLKDSDNDAAKFSVKRVQKDLQTLEQDLVKLTDNERKDELLYLDELGIDAIFCDEADNFLNLSTPTQMGHIPGVNTTKSRQATAMFMACRFIQEMNDNRGIIFATGTDIRNSMSDMYTMMRFLAPQVLDSADVGSFDSFMGTFGEVVKTIEVNPEGSGYRENQRLSKFINIPEMGSLYRQITDVIPSDTLDLPRPIVDTRAVAAEPCEWTKRYMEYLSQRARSVRSSLVTPDIDNILKISNDGRKASLDIRLIDPNLPDFAGSKVNTCINNVMTEYNAGKGDKLTQLIFCDIGIHKKTTSFSVYEEIRGKLTTRGIPADAIAIAQDYNTEAKKKILEEQINSGDIAVCIASTEKLGVGSNVQKRLVALHNLDAPWRPRDLEQRIGRIERQGNLNDKVSVYNYSTIDSFDLFMWETLYRKAGFIVQAKTDPKNAAREIEEDISATYADVMAITTGNPKIKRKIALDGEVEQLNTLERSHQRNQWEGAQQIDRLKASLSRFAKAIDFNNDEIGKLNGAKWQFKGQTFEDVDKAAKFIKEHLLTIMKSQEKGKQDLIIPIGKFGEMETKLRFDGKLERYVLQAKGEETHIASTNKNFIRMIKEIVKLAPALAEKNNRVTADITHTNERIASLQSMQGQPFEHKQKLDDSVLELQTITRELAEEANAQLQNQEESVPFDTQLANYLKELGIDTVICENQPSPDALAELLGDDDGEVEKEVTMVM